MDFTTILQDVYRNSLDGIVISDANTVITDVNPAYEQLTGYSRAELVGQKTNVIKSGRTPRSTFDEMWEQLRTHGKWVGEIINRRKDGSIWYSFLSVTRVFDDDGQVASYVGIARDITSRKQMEQEIRSQANRLRAILESVAEAVLMVDTESTCVVANHQIRDVLGLTPDEVLGRSLHELRLRARPRFGDGTILDWAPGPDGSPPVHTEATVVTESHNEAPRIFHEFSAPVVDDAGSVIGRIYVYRDVTKETEVDRMKSEFIATVSHELRTPMTSIKGSLGLLLGGVAGPVSEDVRELLAMAETNTDRLIRLINDILDISRIEAGKMEMRKAPLQAAEAIGRARQELEGYANLRSIAVQLDLPEGLPPVLADSDRLQQVLVNLLSNAIKFSDPHKSVTISAKQEGDEVWIAVRDEGPGIPAHYQEQLFAKFYRVDNGASRKTGGTGLGLAICKAIVTELGGRIWVESEVGRGSTFTFTLPIDPNN